MPCAFIAFSCDCRHNLLLATNLSYTDNPKKTALSWRIWTIKTIWIKIFELYSIKKVRYAPFERIGFLIYS